MSTIAFVSEDELRAIPGVDLSQYTPTTISGMLVRATALAENFLNYSLAFETKVEKVKGMISSDGDIVIYPNKRPIVALNSASIIKGAFSSALTLSGGGDDYFDIIDDSRIVIASSQVSLSQVSIINWQSLRLSNFYIQVSYDCGYHPYDRPQDIVEAVLLYAQDILSKARNSSGASEISQGALSIKYGDSKGKSDFIKDAELILENYKPVTGF